MRSGRRREARRKPPRWFEARTTSYLLWVSSLLLLLYQPQTSKKVIATHYAPLVWGAGYRGAGCEGQDAGRWKGTGVGVYGSGCRVLRVEGTAYPSAVSHGPRSPPPAAPTHHSSEESSHNLEPFFYNLFRECYPKFSRSDWSLPPMEKFSSVLLVSFRHCCSRLTDYTQGDMRCTNVVFAGKSLRCKTK